MAEIKQIKVDSTTYDITDANALRKVTYEWNKDIAFGSSGYLLIGKFPMYDSNITIDIDSTTSTTYHATLVIATQNINTSRGGTYVCNVYGDASNTATSSFVVQYSSGSNKFNVYFKPSAWSKNLIHIRAVALAAAPTESEICTSVTSVPTTDLITINNMLTANFLGISATASDATKLGGQAATYYASTGAIPASPVNADWNATTGLASILNKPTLGTAASLNSNTWLASNTNYTSKIKIGTASTEYSPTAGVITLPAYPTDTHYTSTLSIYAQNGTEAATLVSTFNQSDNRSITFKGGDNVTLNATANSGVITISATNTTYTASSGISLYGTGSTIIGHANSAIEAQTTQGLYPIKIDSYGHITEYGTAVSLADYMPLSGTTSLSGNIVPTSNNSVNLGASDKGFRSVYGTNIYTSNIRNASQLFLTAGSYDTDNTGKGIQLEAQNHWAALYTSVASGYYGIGIYSGNTLFSIRANKSFGSEYITIGHDGISTYGLNIKLQTHNNTSINIYTEGMDFIAKQYVEMRASESGGYIGLDNTGVHMWAGYSDYEAAQFWLGTYNTMLTGGYMNGLMPNLAMTSSYIVLGWHPSHPSSYMYLMMSQSDCIMYNPYGGFGINFHLSACAGFITNYMLASSAGTVSVFLAAQTGYFSFNGQYWDMRKAPIRAGYCHNVYMYQASKFALRFTFEDFNYSPVNSSVYQTNGMQSTSTYCKGALSRLAKYLYWNGYTTSSKALPATGFYSGAGSKVALGIWATGTTSDSLSVMYINTLTTAPNMATFTCVSSTTANIYIYDTVGACNLRASDGFVYTFQS